MATELRDAASPLEEDDLKYLHEALYKVRDKFRPLGLQIGLKMSDIRAIEAKLTDPGDQLLEALSVRLKQAETLTWSDIDKALRSDCVSEGKTADDIRKNFVCSKPSVGNVFSDSSDSDDCDGLPEIELSGEESKKLRRLFKRSFGKLCCLNFNPIETAASLQKRGIISVVVMKDMLMSPESRQAKIISLVSGLDVKIKKRPDLLLGIIEVFKESDVLREEGDEMSKHASKILADFRTYFYVV